MKVLYAQNAFSKKTKFLYNENFPKHSLDLEASSEEPQANNKAKQNLDKATNTSFNSKNPKHQEAVKDRNQEVTDETIKLSAKTRKTLNFFADLNPKIVSFDADTELKSPDFNKDDLYVSIDPRHMEIKKAPCGKIVGTTVKPIKYLNIKFDDSVPLFQRKNSTINLSYVGELGATAGLSAGSGLKGYHKVNDDISVSAGARVDAFSSTLPTQFTSANDGNDGSGAEVLGSLNFGAQYNIDKNITAHGMYALNNNGLRVGIVGVTLNTNLGTLSINSINDNLSNRLATSLQKDFGNWSASVSAGLHLNRNDNTRCPNTSSFVWGTSVQWSPTKESFQKLFSFFD